MSAKRALVVDDSKSARAFLSRLLEVHAIEVDSAETAEQAIDYLTRHRPDVIFMDHLMPGMDGFQAVQAIKSNPRTATIPILMYTSQEGELYVGQARALGAIGVLPKEVAPIDVSKILQQLRLIDGLSETQPTPVMSEEIAAGEIVAMSYSATGTQVAAPVPEAYVRDQIAELRRFIVTSLDQHSERILDDVKGAILAVPQPVAVEPQAPPRHTAAWATALAATLAAAAMAGLWWQESVSNRALSAQLAARFVPALRPDKASLSAPAAPATAPFLTSVAELTILSVPFGEAPLSGSRVEQLRQVVSTLAADGFVGTVQVRRYAGRFCLTGTSGDGYSLSAGDIPYLQCDLVADATDATLGAPTPESIAFANTLAELRKMYGESIYIEVAEGNALIVQRRYPEVGGTPPRVPSAAEWNAAAVANNRVELHWRRAT